MELNESHKTVLLISDDRIDNQKIERQFMDIGSMECKVHNVATVTQAIEQLTRKGLKVDVIILDMRLKGDVALAALFQSIQSNAQGIPIIALNTDSDDSRALEDSVMKMGAAACINRSHIPNLVNIIKPLLMRSSA